VARGIALVTALTVLPPFHTFTTDTQMLEDRPAQYKARMQTHAVKVLGALASRTMRSLPSRLRMARAASASFGAHPISEIDEKRRDDVANIAVVIDDEDMLRLHVPSLSLSLVRSEPPAPERFSRS
jgi:hypothetical protein